MPITYRGHVSVGGGSSTVTSVDVPPTTQIGDLLVVAISLGSSSTPWEMSVTDSRFTLLRRIDPPVAIDTTDWAQAGVWYGEATSLDPVSLVADPGGSDFVTVVCFALQAKLDPTRIASIDSTAFGYTLPGLPRKNGGALAVIAGRTGLGEKSWDVSGDYAVEHDGIVYSTIAVGVMYDAPGKVVPATPITFEGGASVFHSHAMVVALDPVPEGAPPARLFPREDGLGVGGGRHFPPARSQQRSGRRFGYY